MFLGVFLWKTKSDLGFSMAHFQIKMKLGN